MSKRAYLYPILALSIIFFALASNYFWLKGDDSICGMGSILILRSSIEFFYDFSDIFKENTTSIWTKLKEVIGLSGRPVRHSSLYWPNGLNLGASIFYFFLGNSLLSAKLSLLPYLFILLFSTYLIGRLIYSDFVGILALFFLFSYPLIFQSSRQFQLDFPLTAMVSLNILLLLKCDNFKNRLYSFLFGLALGWAMLIKGQVMLFIIWPLFFVLYRTFANSRKGYLAAFFCFVSDIC